MDEAEAVLERIERIRALERGDAPAGVLLDELRQLVVEAEEWARAEGDARARAATVWLGADVARLQEVIPRNLQQNEHVPPERAVHAR